MPAALESLPPTNRISLGFLRQADIIAWLTVAVSGLMLVGWIGDWPALTGAALGMHPLHGYTCVGFFLAGMMLLVIRTRRHRDARIPAGGALLLLGLSLANLLEQLGLVDLGLGHWTLSTATGPHAARMPLMASIIFLLLALRILVFCQGNNARLSDALSVMLIGTSMLALAALGIAAVDGADHVFSTATPVAAILLLLNSLAWIAIRPTTPLGRIVVTRGPGGVIARRLLLPTLLLPLLYGWLVQWARTFLGLDDSSLIALSGVAIGGSVALLVWHVAVYVDRTERQRTQLQRLRTEADTDSLTGLANRRMFDATLERLLQRRRAHDSASCLLMLDLDQFKSYNDSFGHDAGDQVLRQVGLILCRGLRPGDLAARYGGEEFAVLLAECDATAGQQAAERIRQAFLAHAWPRRPVTISIGVALMTLEDTAASLLKRADAALYAAKQQGRNRVVSAG